jgi:hypothetical protein
MSYLSYILFCTLRHTHTAVQFLNTTYWCIFLKLFNNLENDINAKYVTHIFLIYLYITRQATKIF